MYPTLYSIACNFRVLGFLCIKVDCLSIMHYDWAWFHPCFAIRIRNGVKLMTAEWRAPDYLFTWRAILSNWIEKQNEYVNLKIKSLLEVLAGVYLLQSEGQVLLHATVTKKEGGSQIYNTSLYYPSHICATLMWILPISSPSQRIVMSPHKILFHFDFLVWDQEPFPQIQPVT
jgi:hypothetical protein